MGFCSKNVHLLYPIEPPIYNVMERKHLIHLKFFTTTPIYIGNYHKYKNIEFYRISILVQV